jgi:hypothetical protein
LAASAAVATRQAFSASMLRALLIAVVMSTRSVTCPRERCSCTSTRMMTGEVDMATAPASQADATGAPNDTRLTVTHNPASRPSSTQVKASHGLSINQRGRTRLPSSNTSTPMARSISGFQGSRSVRSSRRSASGLASAPVIMWPTMRGSRSLRCSSSPSTTATSMTSAKPSTGSAPRKPSSVHRGAGDDVALGASQL